MKILLYLILGIILTGCGEKPDASSVKVSTIMEVIDEKTDFKDKKIQDMKDEKVARSYGINPSDIDEGQVYYTGEEGKSDKIIVVKAKDKHALENIEKTLSALPASMAEAWQDEDNETKKIDRHLIKTNDLYTIFAVSGNIVEIEEIFDRLTYDGNPEI